MYIGLFGKFVAEARKNLNRLSVDPFLGKLTFRFQSI